tara:strand:+ start:1323 stop:1745 length:423 start_codon:yes stop_codon:yes gene_type:complete
MEPLSYYKETSVSIPKQDDYMTIYYYKTGVMVGMKRQFETDYEPPKNCIEEKVLDEVSYSAHMKLYQEESVRLQNEFRKDLIVEYKMSHHSKADKLFNKAWDMGCSVGYEEVEYCFRDLAELFQDSETNVNENLFGLMAP